MRWRAPRPCGASPTQPYKCGQNVKIKINVKINVKTKIINGRPWRAVRVVCTVVYKRLAAACTRAARIIRWRCCENLTVRCLCAGSIITPREFINIVRGDITSTRTLNNLTAR